MDHWSREQLRRMQLGGSRRLREFFQGYPELREAPQTKAALSMRYGSRAAGHYRRLLDAKCRELPEEAATEEAQLPPAPTPAEGHLPDTTNTTVGQSVVVSSVGTGAGDFLPGSGSTMADDGEAGHGSLEEEREALWALYRQHTRQGDTPGSPLHGSSLHPTAEVTKAAAEEAGAATAGAAVAAAASVAVTPSHTSPFFVSAQARPAAQTDDSEGGI